MPRDPYPFETWAVALILAGNRALSTGERQRVVQDRETRRWVILPAEVAEPCS